MNRVQSRTEPSKAARLLRGLPVRRSRPRGIMRLALLALSILVLAPPSAGAGPFELALPAFPDITGASGETQAVFLNPAAAVGLPQPAMSLWAVVPDPRQNGGPPAYALALLDSGGQLAGGLVAVLVDDEPDQPLSLSYSAAGRLGPVALGLRPAWTREDLPGGSWTFDAGFIWELAPWASLGIAGLDLPLGQPASSPPTSQGLAGLTLTATGLDGTLLEGTQLSLGLSDPNLDVDAALVAQAGFRLPVGEWFRLVAGYEHDTRSGEPLGWSGSLALRAGQVFVDLGYQADAVYHAGIQVGW